MSKVASALLIVLAVIVSSVSFAGAQGVRPGDKTIAEIAIANGNFTTLVAALSCTNLVPAVSNPDTQLTVFAPTDAAFGALGLNASNVCSTFDTATLTDILLYHVTEGRRPSPSVVQGRNKSIDMLAGGAIYPAGRGSLQIVDNVDRTVNIVAADISASNGIIHVIDGVLLPFAP